MICRFEAAGLFPAAFSRSGRIIPDDLRMLMEVTVLKHFLLILLCLTMVWTAALPATAADYSANPMANGLAADLTNIIHRNHHDQTGIVSNVGLTLGSGAITLSGHGADPNGQFRIGSQSKMFTGSVVLLMIDRGYLKLTDTIGELQQKYSLDLGLAQLPAGTESITVEQLLNMDSRIPNYMSGARSGSSSILWDEWIAANYGVLTPPVTHEELAALGLAGYPQIPSPPFQGSYSNTNAIILSLIGEAAYAAETGASKTFAEILDEMVLAPAGLTNTYLAMTPDSTGIIPGKESGQTITDMDPTIPWTSGAVVSTLEDQLKWLEILKTNILPDGTSFLSDALFAARTDLANSTLISMAGMPLLYGYNVFTLDFTNAEIPLTIIGHGGSIAGYSSFSAWYQQLGLGLVTNALSLSTIDAHGVHTSTPSEALLMDLCHGLERLYRADGVLTGLAGVSAGANGGYFTFDPIITDAVQSTSFVVDASGRTTSYMDLTFLALGGNPMRKTIDPTLTYYTDTADTAAVTLTNGVSGRVAAGARAEAYGTRTSVFHVGSGATLDLDGEVAAYGEGASAISVGAGGSLHTAGQSLAYMQGGAGSAVQVRPGASEVTIAGTLLSLGSSSALRLDGAQATVEASGNLGVYTAAHSMTPDFTTVSPQTHAAYGAVLENGAVLDLYGRVMAQAVNPWDGVSYTPGAYISDMSRMPGVLTAGISLEDSTANVYGVVAGSGYGAWMRNGASNLNIVGGAVSGELLSIKGEDGNDNVVISDRGLVHGNIDLGAGDNSLTATGAMLVLDLASGPGIQGADTLVLDAATRIETGLTGVLGDAGYVLATDVATYAGSPMVENPYRSVTFALSEAGGDVILTSSRDWDYYTANAANDSLGRALDRMAAAAVSGALSSGGHDLIETLDMSSTVKKDTAQLQPHAPNGLAMAQLRQTQILHKTIATKSTAATENQWFAFGAFHGHFGSQDASGQAWDDYDTRGGGAIVGLGRNLNSRLQAGLFLGYGTEELDYAKGGDVEDTILRFGPFVRWTSGPTEWSAELSLGLHDVESDRNVPFLNEKNHADYTMQDVRLSTALSHALAFECLTVRPFVEGAYLNLASAGYKEDGGDSALAVDSLRADYLATTAGLELSRTFMLKSVAVTPRLSAAWWRNWLDQPDVNAALRSDPGFGFSTTGADLDDNLLRLNAALDVITSSGLRLNLEYGRYDGPSMQETTILGFSIGGVF